MIVGFLLTSADFLLFFSFYSIVVEVKILFFLCWIGKVYFEKFLNKTFFVAVSILKVLSVLKVYFF